MMHKLKCYMAIVEQAKLHLLNILNLFFKNTHLLVTINLSCLIKEANCIVIQRFAICSASLGMRYDVLVLMRQIRMDLWNVLTASSQIAFGLYFLDLDYLPISGLTRLIMY